MKRNYLHIVFGIYFALPFTLLKQRFFFRLRKVPAGLPDFLCIGTQKSGTTWLYEQLKKHPGICLADEKEVHYFDWFFHRPLRWYLSHFTCAAGKVKGEITPGYSIIEKGKIRFIRRIMPDVKLILLLRDPRARAWSSARFRFGNQLGRKLSEVSTEEFIRHFEADWVKRRGDYETIWNNWTSVFPREQLLVLFMEDVRRQPEQTMTRVCEFLGVEISLDETQLRSRANQSPELEIPPAVKKYLDDLYLPQIRCWSEEIKKKEWEK
jgi:Sulfotransferase domain